MRCYLRVLRACGLHFTGEPRYVHPSAYFDDLARITLGARVVISRDVKFLTHDYSITTAEIAVGKVPPTDVRRSGTIVVEENVFIGLGSILLPNSAIGRDSVVGAGSVVRGKIPAGSVVIGNPAKVIMPIDEYSRLARANSGSWTIEVDPR